MDVLHITQTKNIPSIMKNGIKRSIPLLSQYNRVMEEDYGENYDKDKGLVFGIPENLDRRDKYIKDFFYWKTWGDVRNIFLKDTDCDQYDKWQDEGPKVFSHLKMSAIGFSVLLVDIPFVWTYNAYRHAQSVEMGVLWKDMNVKYEHYNKPLVLVNYDIEPDRIKKVIGTGESKISRNNEIDISLKI